MSSNRIYRYSIKHFERIIKYIPIISGFFHIDKTLKLSLYYSGAHLELLPNKHFALFSPFAYLIHGSIYLLCPTAYISIPIQHQLYIAQLKNYKNINAHSIIQSLKECSRFILFTLFSAKLIPYYNTIDTVNLVVTYINTIIESIIYVVALNWFIIQRLLITMLFNLHYLHTIVMFELYYMVLFNYVPLFQFLNR